MKPVVQMTPFDYQRFWLMWGAIGVLALTVAIVIGILVAEWIMRKWGWR